MNDLMMRYLLHLEHNRGLAEATVNKYRLCLERFEAYLADQGAMLADATPDHLHHFSGMFLHTQGMSPRARRPLISCLRGFYSWLQREHIVKTNPAQALEYPKIGRKLPKGIQRDQIERLLMAPDLDTFLGVRDTAIMMMLAGTGIRVSGLCAMNESDLVFLREEGREHLVIKVREKGGHERYIPAPEETRLMCLAYLGHDELASIDRTLPDGDSILWVSTRRRDISPADYHGEARRLAVRSVGDMLAAHGARAGLPADICHPHAFRHLYGTELAEADIDVLTIQALLGHKDPKTSQIYIHTAMRKLTRVVDKANPLRQVQTPVTALMKRLRSA